MRIANWRQRLRKAFVNSTLYKREFCLSWHAACELEYSWNTAQWLGGSCQGSRSLFCPSGSLGSILSPMKMDPRPGQVPEVPSAAHPGHGASHVSRDSPYQGKEQGSSYCSWRWKHQPTLPKPLGYSCFTTVTDCRLVPTHCMGKRLFHSPVSETLC